jgi:hypothetical protein
MLNGTVVGPYIAPPTGSDLEKWIDEDPPMKLRILHYLVQCALPAGTNVQITYRGATTTTAGVANLGPGIQAGEMSSLERQSVSACLLARVNARGDVIMIDMWGPFPGFDSVTPTELSQFSVTEAAFFGDIFAYPPVALMGTPSGYNRCSSRACVRPDGSCDCGILGDAVVGCLQEGVEQGTTESYFNECYQLSGAQQFFYQIITTRITPKPLGAMCAGKWECASQICAAGVCSSPLADGTSCAADDQCQSQNCQAGVCTPKLACGMACQDGIECANGFCSWPGYLCGHSQGAACSVGADCASCDCYHGNCGGGRVSGAPCASNADCASHSCAKKVGRCS